MCDRREIPVGQGNAVQADTVYMCFARSALISIQEQKENATDLGDDQVL